jgi:hypothetical protein
MIAAAQQQFPGHACVAHRRAEMARMHIDELEIDEALVRGLPREQYPEWVAVPLDLTILDD